MTMTPSSWLHSPSIGAPSVRRRPRKFLPWLLLGACLGMPSWGCRRESSSTEATTEPTATARSAATESQSTEEQSTEGQSTEGQSTAPPTTLLEWQESAYGTTLFLDGSVVVLLTQTALIHIPEDAPARSTPLPLGSGPALMGDSIVYWHDGAVRAVPKGGGEPRTLGPLERQPQRFVATRHGFAWLEGPPGRPAAWSTFRDRTPRVLHRTSHPVASATMLDDWVFFVEVVGGGAWRMGGVSLSGKATAFSATRTGRPPSMLAATHDGIHFYDGPTRSVRRLSPDLEQETVLAEGVICSPLAVSDRVVCAHVGGVYEIPGAGVPPRTLVTQPRGATATIAADARRVVWVADTGEGRLAVRSRPLPPR